ncbi:MAG: ABC transporter permease [Deltaproteobacteria bacterium]|nr:ABC transporter permease [Deltaproteobacteria bacterium]MCB9489614.1 ABC transporter permease [Deltaproteobacteria bacterium]
MTRLRSIVYVAWRYLGHRRLATTVSMLAIAASLVLVIAIGLMNLSVKRAAIDSSLRYPLVIGPKNVGVVQLIMSTIFQIDRPSGTIPYDVFEAVEKDGRVAAAVPMAVADSVRGYPIVGTSRAYLDSLPIGVKAGTIDLSDEHDAVLGAEAAYRNSLNVGDTFTGTHGLTGDEEAHHHEEFGYVVRGILNESGTPSDTSIYVPVESIWAVHAGHHHPHDDHDEDEHHEEVGDHDEDEHHEEAGEHDEAEEHDDDEHEPAWGDRRLTAILVRPASPAFTAILEREISTRAGVQAVDTARAIRRLMTYVSKGERMVEAFSTVTLAVAIAMVLVTLVMSLNERRRELALMRSLGVRQGTLGAVAMAEALIICLGGVIIGTALGHVLAALGGRLIQTRFGIAVDPWQITRMETGAVILTLVAGQVLALAGMVFTARMNVIEEIARE